MGESYYERAKARGFAGDVIAAIDLMVGEGVDPDRAAVLAIAAHRSGQDAEAWARHFIKTLKWLRTIRR